MYVYLRTHKMRVLYRGYVGIKRDFIIIRWQKKHVFLEVMKGNQHSKPDKRIPWPQAHE